MKGQHEYPKVEMQPHARLTFVPVVKSKGKLLANSIISAVERRRGQISSLDQKVPPKTGIDHTPSYVFVT